MKNTFDFHWTGISPFGQKITGSLNTHNKKCAINELIKNGITVLSIKKTRPLFSQKKFNQRELLDFMQQLLLLLQAGIPLSDTLTLISQSTQNTTTKNLLMAIQKNLIAGMSFATALNQFPEYFNKSFCQMISAGEQSGKLEFILIKLIENNEKMAQLKNKTTKALFYPISVFCVALLISAGLLIFVIPQFSAIYANFGGKLPVLTQEVIAISNMLKKHGVFFLTIITSAVFIFNFFLKKLSGDVSCALLKIPFLKSIIITKTVAQWSQILAMTLSASIPLIDALQMANDAVVSSKLRRMLNQTRDAVIAGKSLQTALALCPTFPIRVKYLISIGESADALNTMTGKISALYEQQLFDALDRLSKLAEPVIMIVVASLISGLIVAMYLPIFRMGGVI